MSLIVTIPVKSLNLPPPSYFEYLTPPPDPILLEYSSVHCPSWVTHLARTWVGIRKASGSGSTVRDTRSLIPTLAPRPLDVVKLLQSQCAAKMRPSSKWKTGYLYSRQCDQKNSSGVRFQGCPEQFIVLAGWCGSINMGETDVAKVLLW